MATFEETFPGLKGKMTGYGAGDDGTEELYTGDVDDDALCTYGDL